MTFCTVVWFLALSFTAKQFQTMVVWQGNELLYAEPSIKSDGVEILILKFNLVLCFLNTFDNTMVSCVNNNYGKVFSCITYDIE